MSEEAAGTRGEVGVELALVADDLIETLPINIAPQQISLAVERRKPLLLARRLRLPVLLKQRLAPCLRLQRM